MQVDQAGTSLSDQFDDFDQRLVEIRDIAHLLARARLSTKEETDAVASAAYRIADMAVALQSKCEAICQIAGASKADQPVGEFGHD